MPLCLDRHDVPGASRKEAAAAHLKDVELAGEYGVDFLSYWFDESVGGILCFAQAPSEERLRAIHEASYGFVPNEIIGVSEGEMLRFLGGIHNPQDETEVTSPVRTVVFTDLVGSTAFLTEHGGCDHAPPNSALASDAVRDAAADTGAAFAGPVMTRLKGFPQPIPAFRLTGVGGEDPDPATASPWARLRRRLRS